MIAGLFALVRLPVRTSLCARRGQAHRGDPSRFLLPLRENSELEPDRLAAPPPFEAPAAGDLFDEAQAAAGRRVEAVPANHGRVLRLVGHLDPQAPGRASDRYLELGVGVQNGVGHQLRGQKCSRVPQLLRLGGQLRHDKAARGGSARILWR
jgi:hypothetical protein